MTSHRAPNIMVDEVWERNVSRIFAAAPRQRAT